MAGMLCCAVSVLGYSAANVCMRHLAGQKCDPTWAIFNKELVSVLVVGPWLLLQAFRGVRTMPSGRPLAILIAVGLATELGGNAGMQWALGVVGLAVMVPANMGFLLVAAAVLGRLMLGERISLRTVIAVALLVAAIVLLAQGAGAAGAASAGGNGGATIAGKLGRTTLALAIGIACVAGIIYALLSIAIRHCVTGTTQLSAVVILITGMGVLSLGPLSVYRVGLARLLETPPSHFVWMAVAGVCNLVAFVALIRGLQLTTVVRVNMLNASQVALCALAGVTLFQEPPTWWLLAGIALTIGGIFLIGRPVEQHAMDEHV
jgi:drug/metabolite transporter (DMT)-like permease